MTALPGTAPSVLIVEDEGLIALDLSQRLTALGYQISGISASGENAITRVADISPDIILPDIILMDIRLQGQMDGIEAVDRIRQTADIPVIYVSSYTDDDTVRRAVQTEPMGYLIKPFSDQELRTAIEVALYRHTMEAKLRRQHAWLDSVLHSIADAAVATDEHGAVRLLNRAGEVLTGWSEAQAIGHPLAQVVDLVDDAITGQTMLRRRDGTTVPTEQASASVGNGEASGGAVVLLHDISERLRTEVAQQQAQRMEAVARLASGVAHNFNNLLTIILGESAYALEQAVDLEAARQCFTRIAGAAKTAAGLTRTLLDLGGGQLLNPKPFDVNDLVRIVGKSLGCSFGPLVNFRLETLASKSGVRADREQIERIVADFCRHANDAIRGVGTIVVSTGNGRLPELPDGTPGPDAVTITISDSGPGIAPELRPRVFEPFVVTRPGTEGSGLFLAGAFGVVTRSGGTIVLESGAGVGSRFTIFLPACEELPPPPVRVSPSAAARTRILLAEDDQMVRRFEAMVLRRDGLNVLEASNGLEGLALFRASPDEIRLLVTDVAMPGMSGVELARQILRICPDLPVLFVSGYAGDAVQLDSFPPGAAAFLRKPFAPSALLEAVAALAGKSQGK